jgi:arylformamidase
VLKAHGQEPSAPFDAALEHDYVFSDRYAERTAVYEAIAASSEAARREWPVSLDLAYGTHPRERLDLFACGPGSPLLIFVHGGYWSRLHKSSFSYVAPPFLRRGFSVAIMGYPLAPSMRIAEIARSVRRGVRWLASEGAPQLAGAGAFYLCGHSAGAHLAVSAALGEPNDEPDAGLRARVAGCAALSGIFDLRPLVRTTIAGRIGLDEASAPALSPLLKAAPPGWLLAGVGGAETSSFIDQTRRYVEHCRALGAEGSMLVLPAANHYTVLLDLARDDGLFVQAIHSRVSQGSGGTS